MIWRDRISLDPEILTGKTVIKGTRLALEFMVDLLANVWSQSKTLQNYPGGLIMIFRPVFALQGP